MSLDFGPSIRTTIINESPISGLLSEWNGEPAVFTRLPVPEDAAYPYIVVAPDTSVTDLDAVNSLRPVVVRDIHVFGQQPDDYRTIETIGYLLRDLFHRERFSVSTSSHDIIGVTATGPRPSPVSDDETIGRLVSLNIQTRVKP